MPAESGDPDIGIRSGAEEGEVEEGDWIASWYGGGVRYAWASRISRVQYRVEVMVG